MARRAGTQLASSEIPVSRSPMPMNVVGGEGAYAE
jgi:hypothetical protein